MTSVNKTVPVRQQGLQIKQKPLWQTPPFSDMDMTDEIPLNVGKLHEPFGGVLMLWV